MRSGHVRAARIRNLAHEPIGDRVDVGGVVLADHDEGWCPHVAEPFREIRDEQVVRAYLGTEDVEEAA